ncbi:MAG: glycosyltransferase family 4 protein [Planctomycetota bacterium]
MSRSVAANHPPQKDEIVVCHARVVTGTGGGPEKTILNSPRHLAPFGYRAVCAYMHPPGDSGFEVLRSRAEALSAPLVGIEDRGPLDFRVVRRMLDLCRTERVSIWHAHDYKSNFLGLLLRRFWPMRLVTTVHGWVKFTRRTPLYYGIDRFSLPRYERVLCVSEDLHLQCLGYGVSRERCILVENGIDTISYTRRMTSAQAKERLGLDVRRPLIGAVGRLSAEKGFAGLIRAVDRLLAEGIEADLVILGDGDQREELSRLIAALGRQDCIRLLGYRSDATDWYHAMDIFASSSVREGLPNVLLEAMALEVPVVATRIAGIPRLIEDDSNGLLVEPGDGNALHDALRRLLLDTRLCRALAVAGRRTIEDRYSFDRRMAKVRAIYEDLLRPSTEHRRTAVS